MTAMEPSTERGAEAERRKAGTGDSVIGGLRARYFAFVAEQFPFALTPAREAFELVCPKNPGRDVASIERVREALAAALNRALDGRPPVDISETTPRVSAAERLRQARREFLEACDGFLEREAIAASLTRDERIEILRGMILTRATDNRLKAFFTGGEVRWRGDAPSRGRDSARSARRRSTPRRSA